MNNDFEWCYYQARIYQVLQLTPNQALILYPGATGPGAFNVAPNGPALLINGMLWVDRSLLQLMPSPTPERLPAIPTTPGLQVGSRCQWGTSLAEWAVLSIDGNIAKVRQVSGYAKAIVWDAPVGELVLLGQPVAQPVEAKVLIGAGF